jgi:hypothetical protein
MCDVQDLGEMQARKEYAQGKQTPGGYHSLDISLSSEAQEALKALKEKRVNWLQLVTSLTLFYCFFNTYKVLHSFSLI